ncbi:MAG: pseudouridine synthase, partial [Bacteroidales bacterium]|nr:pseudouridine synthase [Bacteroidales bacterium]
YGDEPLMAEKKVYLLLNKPKDFITTTDDPEGRRTVLDLVKKACPERVFPVGRLDRETLGLLLLTNDGEMAKKLTHPSHQVQKVYHVYLDKNLTKTDMQRLVDGVELEDGMAFVDTISFAGTGEDKSQVGVEIHSGKNRIVRRLFDAIGYKVIKLDRVMFAGLTKKDLPRGHYRFLSLKEVNYLKMI